eukprot:CAMPEP_0182495576 /NCGR_PEP_ID=MMETSP1321-20130603/4349_1 /TAXON_ID=91990 /ORGANISM="Bolidomonas sp., Strain RCC1657" /LENGTH=76 /DNA_ID=CAMNT_0024698997 /DNA_START=693 /DNA_END=923 /DNA_ORIENTATION=+
MAVADVVAELLYDFVPWFIPTIIVNAAAILKPQVDDFQARESFITGEHRGDERLYGIERKRGDRTLRLPLGPELGL